MIHSPPTFTIRLEGVSRRYGTTVALDPTDLDVRRGEFLTLLGPSGSGKTTLLNIISGMVRPSTGRVFIDGADVTDVSPAKRGLGMVFQNYALMPHMTVFENIAFPLRIRRVPRREIRRRVENVLDLVRLPHLAARKPRELSGGQQQRIALARCIVYEPSLILMDEPLGALDKKLREQMQTEIRRLHRELGVTMLYVTHDQEEAMTMSDRVVLMRDGGVEQVGTPADLYFLPGSEFAANFIGTSNLIDLELTGDGRGRIVPCDAMVPLAGEVPASGRAKLLLRPEALRLMPADAPERGYLSGTLVSSLLLGGAVRHDVQVSPDLTLVVHELADRSRRPFPPGTRVQVAWDPANARVLPP